MNEITNNNISSRLPIAYSQSLPTASLKDVSQEQIHKELAKMFALLTSVLGALTGNSIDSIELATKTAKTYAEMVGKIQDELQEKLKEIAEKTKEIKKNTQTQKTLQTVSYALCGVLFVLGAIAIFTGVGAGIGVAAIGAGVSMGLEAALVDSGAIDAIEKEIDKSYTANGTLDVQKSAQAKLAAKMGITAVITLLTCAGGYGAGKLAVKAAQKAAETGAKGAAKAADILERFSLGGTGKEMLKNAGKIQTFNTLSWTSALNATEDIVAMNTGKDAEENVIATTVVNAALTVFSLLYILYLVKKGKAAKAEKSIDDLDNAASASKKTDAAAKPKTPKAAAIQPKGALKPGIVHKIANKIPNPLDKRNTPIDPNNAQKIFRKMFLILQAVASVAEAGTQGTNSYLNIVNGQIKIASAFLEKETGDLKADEKFIDNAIEVNDDFIKMVNSFISTTMNILRNASKDPASFIAHETEFARAFSQAV